MDKYTRRPGWLKLPALGYVKMDSMRSLVRQARLHTVCENARCPNRIECYNHSTATFLILGNRCTRSCTFCAVAHGIPEPIDRDEPRRIIEVVNKLRLKYVVITSVTRDDLHDGGAGHFIQTIKAIRKYDNKIAVEILIPDFQGSLAALQTVISVNPVVLNHNIETVPRLYSEVRPGANYQLSIQLLREAKIIDRTLVTKSGIMLGLGENRQEVYKVMTDLRRVGCDIVTIGQYLQPSFEHHELKEYVMPEEFIEYRRIGKELGFACVVAGPLVRSSFQAAESYLLAKDINRLRKENVNHLFSN